MNHREVTVLALVETVAAAAFAVWIVWHFRVVTHIVLSGVLTPFLLLRTRWSTKLALRWFDEGMPLSVLLSPIGTVFGRLLGAAPEWAPRLQAVLRRNSGFVGVFISIGYMLLLSLYCLIILDAFFNIFLFTAARVASIVVACLTFRLRLLKYVPRNWARYAFHVDTFHPPEVLPGIESIPSAISTHRLSSRINSMQSVVHPPPVVAQPDPTAELGPIWRYGVWLALIVPGLMALVPYVALISLPSTAYRWAMKSTSIVWAPLVFLVHERTGRRLSGHAYASEARYGASARAARWWGALVGGILILLYTTILLERGVAAAAFKSLPPAGLALLEPFLPADPPDFQINGWHIARVINGAIAIWLNFYADRALFRLESGYWSDTDVRRVFERCHRVQRLLTAYTIYCTIAILARFTFTHDLPTVTLRLFPW